MTTEQLELVQDEDRTYHLSQKSVATVVSAAFGGDINRVVRLLEPLHAADIADLLEQINTAERRAILTAWRGEFDADVLSELDESLRAEVMNILAPQDLADAVRELETDDVVDLIEDLDAPQQEAVLETLPIADRAAIEQSLTFPEDSAGRLMQRETVAGPEHWTVGDAINFLRAETDLPDQFYHMILVDPSMTPVGYVTLGKMLSTDHTVPLIDIVEESFRTFHVAQPEEDVAYAFNQYHLISAPVVDDYERLVGVITIDDAMAVLDDEAEEDILRLAGVSEGSLSDRVIETTKQRFPWLAVNLVTAILASMVIAQFEDAISTVVALAVLMPIVASMGGNAGTQSLTVAVRALATKDITSANVLRVIRREVLVGLLNGIIFAVLIGLIGFFWFGSAALGGVIAVAMVVNMVVAGLAVVIVPVGLERAGIDPALASGAFVTTVTDVIGFFAFLGLAALVLL